MIDNLPEEVKLEILHKLPIKTLGQCMCVSKSWLSLIKNPPFISTHLNLPTDNNNNNNHLLIFRTSSDHLALHFDNNGFNPYTQLNLPFKTQNPNFRDSGTCNGLICLVEQVFYYDTYVDKSIVLWNPTVKKTLTLPKPNITRLTDGPHKVFHGLGFDSSTEDYKLVRILSPQDYNGVEVTAPEAEFFSLNRNSWTTVTQIVPKYNIVCAGSHAFVNGVLHWIGHEIGRGDNTFWCLIVGFDMGGEVSREIMLPEGRDCWIPFDITVFVVYKESTTTIGVCFPDLIEHKFFEIWVMREYGNVESWNKVWRLDWELGGQLPAALGFRSNGEVFLEGFWSNEEVFLEERNIISVHVEKEGKNKVVVVVGTRDDDTFFSCPVSYYVESLVLLDNPNAVSYASNVPTDANIISSDAAHDDEPMDIDDSNGDAK